jgi:hypothetical protein
MRWLITVRSVAALASPSANIVPIGNDSRSMKACAIAQKPAC